MKIVTILFLFLPTLALAMEYFNSGINYWGEIQSKSATELKPTEEKPKTETQEIPQAETFSWKKAQDSKNEEFYREGDHLPPKAFMVTFDNPSDENIKQWFKLIEIKNKKREIFNQRVQEYLAKHGSALDGTQQAQLKSAYPAPKPISMSPNDYRFRMYFDSKCPHCKRMMDVLSELQQDGFYVEIVQTDSDTKSTQALPFPIQYATREELEQKQINSVPVLFIGDLRKKVILRLSGYRSKSEILDAIARQN